MFGLVFVLTDVHAREVAHDQTREEQGCATSSRAEYDSMTLRIGFSNCCKHLNMEEVRYRILDMSTKVDESVTRYLPILLCSAGCT